jgi:hypothetical protein
MSSLLSQVSSALSRALPPARVDTPPALKHWAGGQTLVSPAEPSASGRIKPAGVATFGDFADSLSDLPGFAGFHHLVEIDEERVGIVGAGGGLRVVLDGEDGKFRVAQSLDGAIVEVDLGDFGAAFF